MSEPETITITGYEEAKDAYRQKTLRQALYDAGEVIMADVIVNLHGDVDVGHDPLPRGVQGLTEGLLPVGVAGLGVAGDEG